jgi:membrane protein implicated in regulation of membrane protease activity
MFGISFWKVVVLVAVIAIVWFGYRWFQRWDQERERLATARTKQGGREVAEELIACRVCGAYVPAKGFTPCGKPNCPALTRR